MMHSSLHTASHDATQSVGEALAKLLAAGDVIILSGDLGAGKTQLTKGLAAGLGVSEPVTSPTFNILLVHEGRIPLYHFDLYRLDTEFQLEDLDYWGTLESDGVSVVEWGDKFPAAVPEECVSVTIHIVDDATRSIEIAGTGNRSESLVREWREVCVGMPGVKLVTDEGGCAC